jgi:hypothetical protein
MSPSSNRSPGWCRSTRSRSSPVNPRPSRRRQALLDFLDEGLAETLIHCRRVLTRGRGSGFVPMARISTEGIAERTATFETRPRTPEDIVT